MSNETACTIVMFQRVRNVRVGNQRCVHSEVNQDAHVYLIKTRLKTNTELSKRGNQSEHEGSKRRLNTAN